MMDVTIHTTVLLEGHPDMNTTVVLYGVDDYSMDFLVGSCKNAVGKLMREKTADENPYTLHYQTVTSDGESRPGVTVSGMSKSQIFGFLRFAIDELGTLNAMRYCHANGA